MQLKTSSLEFEKFGSVYEQPVVPDHNDMISREWHLIARRSVSQLYHFDCEVFLEMQSGMAALVVGDAPEADQLQAFAVHRLVRLNPGVYFSLVAVTSHITCRLITTNDYKYTLETRDSGILLFHPQRRLSFQGGEAQLFRAHLCGPGHAVHHRGGEALRAEGEGADDLRTGPVPYPGYPGGLLLNKVFGYDKKIYTLIKTFVTESTSQIPYMNSLMLCLLQETIIRLLQSEFIGKKNDRPVTGARQHYQDELLEKILAYIDETIYEPLSIAELCQKFSMSRSSLQILFKENMDISPKKYINEMKLEKSRQMICENKYTISEIALMLGFNSIHYFSRAFTQKYHMAPSEYSKTLYKA